MPTTMHGLYSALAVLVVIAVIGGTLYIANLDRPGRVHPRLHGDRPPTTRTLPQGTRYIIRQRGRDQR